MNEQSQLKKVLSHYHLTLEYVGYDTLPFLPGWSHYEALALDPELFAHHKAKYAEHVAKRKEEQKARDHVGCEVGKDCLYSKWICHCNGYGRYRGAHTHK